MIAADAWNRRLQPVMFGPHVLPGITHFDRNSVNIHDLSMHAGVQPITKKTRGAIGGVLGLGRPQVHQREFGPAAFVAGFFDWF